MKRGLSFVLILALCAAIFSMPAMAKAPQPAAQAGVRGVRVSPNQWRYTLREPAADSSAPAPKAMTAKKFKAKITPKNGARIPLGQTLTVKVSANNAEYFQKKASIYVYCTTECASEPFVLYGSPELTDKTIKFSYVCCGNPGDKIQFVVSSMVGSKEYIHAKATYTVAAVPVKKVTLPKKKATLRVGQGEPFYMNASVSPADATNQNIIYTSSNKKVATVDRDTGLVTPLKAGKAKITAKSNNGKKAVCTITVKKSGDPSILPVYRALLFSNEVYDFNDNLIGQTRSVHALELALKKTVLFAQEANPARWNTRMATNKTRKEMIEEIQRLQKEVAEDDVTLIYLGGYKNGYQGVNDTDENSAIGAELIFLLMAIPGDVWIILDGSAAGAFQSKGISKLHLISASFEQIPDLPPDMACAPLAFVLAVAGGINPRTMEVVDPLPADDYDHDGMVSFLELQHFIKSNIDGAYSYPVSGKLQFSCGGDPETTYIFGRP